MDNNMQTDDNMKTEHVASTNGKFGKFGKILGATFGDVAVSAGTSLLGGYISDYFNQRAEKRADARNREMLLDQPGLTAEGRRRAGLNPYGDATIPGVQGQSTTDTTPLVGTNAFSQNVIAMKQLENDTLVAQSQANRNNAEADAIIAEEERNKERFPVSLYGMRLANDLKEFDYSQALQKAPLILRQLEQDIEYQEWQIRNAEKDGQIKDETIKEKRENVLNMQSTRGLIKAQELLAYSNIDLNNAQIDLFDEEKGLVNAEKQFTRLQVKDMFETIKANLASGYYESVSEQSVKRLSYELEKLGRTLWDKPDDATDWWYFWNVLWNIQNCLTLSGSTSTSSGSRVVTKK